MLHSLKEENERKTKETGEEEQKQRTKDFLGGWEQQLRGDCARLCSRSELAIPLTSSQRQIFAFLLLISERHS